MSEAEEQEAVERNWAARGFDCRLWTDPPGRRWEGFRHEEDELVRVLAGEMEFEFEGRICRPARGEELLIPAGVRHSARNVGASAATWLFGYRLPKAAGC